MRRLSRASVRGAALLWVMAVSLSASPTAVQAHAQLLTQTPEDGARLEVGPAQVSLTFDEPVVLGPDGVKVLDSSGRIVDSGLEKVDRAEVRQSVEVLDDGWYVVSWGVVSEDGHVVKAASVFSVGDVEDAARPDAADEADIGAIATGVARALGDLGAIIAAGAVAAWWLLRARSRFVPRLALAAATVSSIGITVWMVIQFAQGGEGWLATSSAFVSVTRLALLGIAGLSLRRLPGVAAGLVVLATTAMAVGGHTTGSLLAIGSEAAHLLAATVWLGAAPAVLLTLRDPDIRDPDALEVVTRFSRLAGFAIVVAGLAGLVLAIELSQTFAAGLTLWLAILLVKVALLLLAVLLGAFGRMSLGREPRRERFRWLFAVDSAILVVVIILSASLTLAPPQGSHAAGVSSKRDSRCIAVVDGSSVVVVADPGQSGSNTITVLGLPPEVQDVNLRFVHETHADVPLVANLEPGPEDWFGTEVLPFAGSWSATLIARVDAFSEVRAGCRLEIDG